LCNFSRVIVEVFTYIVDMSCFNTDVLDPFHVLRILPSFCDLNIVCSGRYIAVT
jgi:hypothetical protein